MKSEVRLDRISRANRTVAKELPRILRETRFRSRNLPVGLQMLDRFARRSTDASPFH